jgi:replication initiation protein RepC
MQQEALDLSPSQVKEINRRLIELGLITMRNSPNGKRYGRRHERTGHIIEAYGFDLAPIDRNTQRYAEFVRLAEEGRVERAAMGRLRRRATIARKAITQILETAQEYGFAGEEWITLAHETAALVRALREVERPEEMEPGVKSMERRQRAARERLEILLGVVDSAPKEPENRPHQYNYKPSLDPDQDTVITANDCSGEGEGADPRSPAPEQRQRSNKGMVHGIRPDELPRLTPAVVPALSRAVRPIPCVRGAIRRPWLWLPCRESSRRGRSGNVLPPWSRRLPRPRPPIHGPWPGKRRPTAILTPRDHAAANRRHR